MVSLWIQECGHVHKSLDPHVNVFTFEKNVGDWNGTVVLSSTCLDFSEKQRNYALRMQGDPKVEK